MRGTARLVLVFGVIYAVIAAAVGLGLLVVLTAAFGPEDWVGRTSLLGAVAIGAASAFRLAWESR